MDYFNNEPKIDWGKIDYGDFVERNMCKNIDDLIDYYKAHKYRDFAFNDDIFKYMAIYQKEGEQAFKNEFYQDRQKQKVERKRTKKLQKKMLKKNNRV